MSNNVVRFNFNADHWDRFVGMEGSKGSLFVQVILWIFVLTTICGIYIAFSVPTDPNQIMKIIVAIILLPVICLMVFPSNLKRRIFRIRQRFEISELGLLIFEKGESTGYRWEDFYNSITRMRENGFDRIILSPTKDKRGKPIPFSLISINRAKPIPLYPIVIGPTLKDLDSVHSFIQKKLESLGASPDLNHKSATEQVSELMRPAPKKPNYTIKSLINFAEKRSFTRIRICSGNPPEIYFEGNWHSLAGCSAADDKGILDLIKAQLTTNEINMLSSGNKVNTIVSGSPRKYMVYLELKPKCVVSIEAI